MRPNIRLGRSEEWRILQEIEHVSDAMFASVGMSDIYETGNVTSTNDLQLARHRDQLWVTTDSNNEPVGWAMSVPIDTGGLHIEQLCVHPNHQRTGLGRALFDACVAFARQNSLPKITLSTFEHVPWNAPVYLRWGCRILADHELTPDLRRIHQEEVDRGLTGDNRVCMVFDVGHKGTLITQP